MIRVKDKEVSLKFYQEVMGMQLKRTSESPDNGFNLYFLGYGASASDNTANGVNPVADQEGLLELTYNYGTEKDESFKYHNGNDQPQGFGHICISVDDLEAACARFEEKGVNWKKRLTDGRMKEIAFVLGMCCPNYCNALHTDVSCRSGQLLDRSHTESEVQEDEQLVNDCGHQSACATHIPLNKRVASNECGPNRSQASCCVHCNRHSLTNNKIHVNEFPHLLSPQCYTLVMCDFFIIQQYSLDKRHACKSQPGHNSWGCGGGVMS
jgi:lactoylglutathione lyase